jgi:Zn-dependent M28 family amino/carboxypeptidase
MLVAYTNEEPPFFGSDQMGSAVHAQSLEGRAVRGMIWLEMIGYFAETQSWPNALFAWIYPNRGDFIGIAGGWSDRGLAREVKRAIAGAGRIDVVSFSGPRETSDASDHRNYWSHGWPAVMITDTAFLRNPNYHTARDTADTLDYTRMARVVDGVLNAVR